MRFVIFRTLFRLKVTTVCQYPSFHGAKIIKVVQYCNFPELFLQKTIIFFKNVKLLHESGKCKQNT